MNRDDRAEPIVLAAEHHLQFLPFDFATRRRQRRLGLVRRFRILDALVFGHRQKYTRLVERLFQLLEARELHLDAFLFFQDRLRRFRIVPEVMLHRLFESSCLRAVSLGTSKTPPQSFGPGFEVGQLWADVAEHC